MNWRIFFLAFTFGLAETWYFGWNWLPHSEAEIICDGITLILYAMAFLAPRYA